MTTHKKKKSLVEIWAFKDIWGKIRLDTRWTFEYCLEHIRKSERLIKVTIEEI